MQLFSEMFRAFKHRNYRIFFVTQLLAFTGMWMQVVGLSWLVYSLTNSAVQLGAIAFCGQIPTLFLVPFGGVAADRFDRYKLLHVTQFCNCALATLLAVLTLTNLIQVWELYVIALGFGVVNSFDAPTRQAFIVRLVGKEDLANAISLNSSVVNGARLIGPAAAGMLVAWIGEGWCFAANALGYFCVLVGLRFIKLEPYHHEGSEGGVLHRLQTGWEFVRKNMPIAVTLLMLGIMSLTNSPQMTLMPVFARDILHGGPNTLGLLLGVSGAGALVGALGLAARQAVLGLEKLVALASVGMGIGFIFFGYSQTLWFSCVLMVIVGYCIMVQMASSNTLIQAMVPDNLRGRVMAFHAMMFMGLTPLGSLISGFLGEHLGASHTMAIAGSIMLITGIAYAWNLRNFRRKAELLLQATEQANKQ